MRRPRLLRRRRPTAPSRPTSPLARHPSPSDPPVAPSAARAVGVSRVCAERRRRRPVLVGGTCGALGRTGGHPRRALAGAERRERASGVTRCAPVLARAAAKRSPLDTPSALTQHASDLGILETVGRAGDDLRASSASVPSPGGTPSTATGDRATPQGLVCPASRPTGRGVPLSVAPSRSSLCLAVPSSALAATLATSA